MRFFKQVVATVATVAAGAAVMKRADENMTKEEAGRPGEWRVEGGGIGRMGMRFYPDKYPRPEGHPNAKRLSDGVYTEPDATNKDMVRVYSTRPRQ